MLALQYQYTRDILHIAGLELIPLGLLSIRGTEQDGREESY